VNNTPKLRHKAISEARQLIYSPNKASVAPLGRKWTVAGLTKPMD